MKWKKRTLDELWDVLKPPFTYEPARIPPLMDMVVNWLSEFMQENTPPPCVIATSRGGIILDWHTRGIDLEVEFLPAQVRYDFHDQIRGDAQEVMTQTERVRETIRLLSMPETK